MELTRQFARPTDTEASVLLTQAEIDPQQLDEQREQLTIKNERKKKKKRKRKAQQGGKGQRSKMERKKRKSKLKKYRKKNTRKRGN